LGLLLS